MEARPAARLTPPVHVLAAALAFALAAHALPAAEVRVEIADPKGAPVADAVASLMPLDRPAELQPPPEPVLVVQDNEEFTPYVTAILVGTRVDFPNRDKVQHHVYSLSQPRPFELPLHRGETKEPVRFDQPGVVTLGCNIHDWMAAYLVVLSTPHFAKSGDDGHATLRAVPAGRYRLEIWHPRIAAAVTREVILAPGNPSTQVISVTLRPDRRIRRAPESGAATYR